MISRDIYDADHELFRDMVNRFMETEVKPFHAQWERDGEVSRQVWKQAGALGLLCPTVEEAYGGVGADFRFNCVVVESFMRAGFTGLGFGLHSDIAAPYIQKYGSEALKHRLLPTMVDGTSIAAIAMTEPGAGSDLQGIKTTAVADGDTWILNGTKTFITNGQMCDLVLVVAKTDVSLGAKGISLFVVEAGTIGFSKGKTLEKVGMKAQDTAELFFNDCRIPKENLLGGLNQGFSYLMQELPQERLSVAVGAMAGAEALLDLTVAYVKERTAFSKPIAAFQNTQFLMAEMKTQIMSARVFIDHCIGLHLSGQLSASDAAAAKLLTTDLQCRVADDCVQLHGGYGYMWEYPVARAWADSRVQKIYAGTNEIMKLIIARDLLKP